MIAGTFPLYYLSLYGESRSKLSSDKLSVIACNSLVLALYKWCDLSTTGDAGGGGKSSVWQLA